MNDSVVRLIDKRGGFSPTDHHDMARWLASWSEMLVDVKARSVVLVVEDGDGHVWQVAQAMKQQDGYRVAGLLTCCAQRVLEGEGTCPLLETPEP